MTDEQDKLLRVVARILHRVAIAPTALGIPDRRTREHRQQRSRENQRQRKPKRPRARAIHALSRFATASSASTFTPSSAASSSWLGTGLPRQFQNASPAVAVTAT